MRKQGYFYINTFKLLYILISLSSYKYHLAAFLHQVVQQCDQCFSVQIIMPQAFSPTIWHRNQLQQIKDCKNVEFWWGIDLTELSLWSICVILYIQIVIKLLVFSGHPHGKISIFNVTSYIIERLCCLMRQSGANIYKYTILLSDRMTATKPYKKLNSSLNIDILTK